VACGQHRATDTVLRAYRQARFQDLALEGIKKFDSENNSLYRFFQQSKENIDDFILTKLLGAFEKHLKLM